MSNLVNDFEVRKETLRALGGDPTGLSNIYEVDLEILKLISGIEPGITDAPIDGVQYARQNGEWTPVEKGIDWNTIKQKLAEDGVEAIKFIMAGEEVILTAEKVKTLLNQTVLPDAPSDGKQYARQDGEWVPVQIPTYMTITIDESAGETTISPTVTGSLPNLNLQYRINNGEWSDFIVGTTADIKVVAGDVVQWKGNNPDGVSIGYNDYLNFVVSGLCHLSGNVMSLIDGVGDALVIPNNLCFFRLFDSSKIKTVSSDFLPATTLQGECYRNLFSNCENLTQAPALPATTLEGYCYDEMFSSCYELKQAPELPAQVLVDGCYNYMFLNSNSLNYVKCLATDNISTSTISGWLSGVSSTGTFVKPDGVTYETGSSGIPEGWTVKESDMIEVPKDGKQYARQNGAWTPVTEGITDSPSDGQQYARQNGAWAVVEKGITDSPSDGQKYARQNGNWAPVTEGITDSPSDGKQYARQDGAWAVVEKGITDSPSDGKQYARQDGAWAVVEKGILDAPIDGVQYARQDGNWTPVEKGLDWNTIKQKLAGDGVESIKFIMGAEEVILTASELKTLLNQTILPDAPSDGQKYARQDGAWTAVTEGITDSPSDGKQYARQDGAWTVVESVEPGIPDAPVDGTQYARQNGAWTVVTEGITDAPFDGTQYARQNGDWTHIKEGIPDAPSDGKPYARQDGGWVPVQTPTGEKYITITMDGNVGETIIHPNIEGTLPNLNLQYRINNEKWMDFIVGTTADIKIGAGDVLQFKGDNKEGVSTSTANYIYFAISGNPVHLSGNVMSLIDGVGDELVIPRDYCFYRLFFNSTVKTVSKEFLPAITLKIGCYEKMFRECQNLTNAPELPATKLTNGCYNELFIGCKNLIQAPALPATTLADNCYHGMFQGCTSLTTAPELPATTLANHCYESMFSGCTSLTQAPALPATTLVDYCYYFMFDSCSNLNYVKALAKEGLEASGALGNWLNGVASTGTFVKPAGVSYGTGSIPEGWTVEEIYEYIEAPMDGNQYTRQDGDWVEVNKVKTTNYNPLQFWSGTQQEFDAIVTKDANTLYIIK